MHTQHTPAHPGQVSVGGPWGELLAETLPEWTLKVDGDLLLSGFRHKPGIQPWIGEHIGKYTLGALPASKLLESDELAAKVRELIEELVRCQEADGYLGTYLPADRWRGLREWTALGRPAQGAEVWDVWVHKYCILALLAYYDETGWLPALDAARKAGDLLLNIFGPDGGGRDINQSDCHSGLASGSVLEAIVLLYEHTGEARYLEFARHLLARWEAADGPRIITVLRARGDVATIGQGKAYEMLSCFVGLVEYARATGDREILQMVLDARDRIAGAKRFPTGGMTNTEFFYRAGLLEEWENIETCVTFSWIQLNLRLYELTGDEVALDLVEEAAWNQLLPALSPRADTWSYHLSMTGPKRFFRSWVQGVQKEKAGQAGAPITCCHTNGQRGLALVPQYAYMAAPDGALEVNFYGLSACAAALQSTVPGLGHVSIEQETAFPRDGTVILNVTPEGDAEYELRLRRPGWSESLVVDGVRSTERRVSVRRRGPAQIKVTLDLRPRVTFCGYQARGKCAIAYGPLVMALDAAPEGLGLDQVGLLLGSGDPAARLSLTFGDDWPAIEAPAVILPEEAVFDAAAITRPLQECSVRLLPVLLAGLQGNPGLDQVIEGEDHAPYNLAKRATTLFPEYRVLLPYFWVPKVKE
jgi:DUF1680 family protein